MSDVVVMDLTVLALNFPEKLNPEIERDNFIQTIENSLSKYNLVTLDGDEGVGKTSLLSQFVIKYPNNAISLFIRPSSYWSYDLELIQYNLYEQIDYLLGNTGSVSPEQTITYPILQNHISKLQREFRKKGKPIYFVVDGLETFSTKNAKERENLFALLPINLTGFKFLFTGDQNILFEHPSFRYSVKNLTLTGFNYDETKKFLGGLDLNDYNLKEIFTSCRGNPGYLSSIRRSLEDGVSIDEVVGSAGVLNKLLDLEWKRANITDAKLLEILVAVADVRQGRSISSLSKFFMMPSEQIKNYFENLKFLQLNDTIVTYVSDSFRAFVLEKLKYLNKSVNNLIIDYWLNNNTSAEAITELPYYLERAGRYKDLLGFLTPQNFGKLVEQSQSLAPIQDKSEIGLKAAMELGKDGSIIQFALQKSIGVELENADVWRSEVKARIALNDFNSALALANSTLIKEDKLHLLVVIARSFAEKGISPDSIILNQIKQLYAEIDKTRLGTRAINIASDLIHIDQELAVQLLEDTTNSNGEEGSFDAALAVLSLTSSTLSELRNTNQEKINYLKSQINNPNLKTFLSEISLFSGNYTADEIIEKTKALDTASKRLLFLSFWTTENSNRTDAIKVIKYALDVIIGTTEYTPTATILRRIATPLPIIKEAEEAKKLVSIFDGQKNLIELGPTEDYVRLQLLLAVAQKNFDKEAAKNRIEEVYLYILDISDLMIRTQCLAYLFASLEDVDPNRELQQSNNNFWEEVEKELLLNIDNLLGKTANQNEATKRIIEALAVRLPDFTIAYIITMLNTEMRQNQAYLEFIDAHLEMPEEKLNITYVVNTLNKITIVDIRSISIVNIAMRLSLIVGKNASWVLQALPLLDHIRRLSDAVDCCQALSNFYKFLIKQEATYNFNDLEQNIEENWEKIDEGWEKVNQGFMLCSVFAEHSPGSAKRFLIRLENFRKTIVFESNAASQSYLACVRLVLRSFSGLIIRKLDLQREKEILSQLIGLIPSVWNQVAAWSEIAAFYFIRKRSDDCKSIVENKINPLLKRLQLENIGQYRSALVLIAGVLYCSHRNTCFELLESLSYYDRNTAYMRIANFLLTKISPFEPYEGSIHNSFNIDYNDVKDICEIIEKMEQDDTIFSLMESLVDSMTSPRAKNKFTHIQVDATAELLKNVVKAKFPASVRHIKHDGYKVLGLALVAKLKGVNSQQEWDKLVNSAKNIPNLADKILVLSNVASLLPLKDAKDIERQNALVQEIFVDIENLPSNLDQIERYEAVAVSFKQIDIYQKCLKAAMKYTKKLDSEKITEYRKRLLNLAALIDPNLVSVLASTIDDDEARLSSRNELKEHALALQSKKNLLTQVPAPEDDLDHYSESASMYLAALNADRANTVPLERNRFLLQIAAKFPITKAFPIISLVVQNAVKHLEKTDQAEQTISSIFDTTVLAAQLVERVSIRSSDQLNYIRTDLDTYTESQSTLVGFGEREKAFGFLKEWFRNNLMTELLICEPYFDPQDIEILKLLQSEAPECKVTIFTGNSHNTDVSKDPLKYNPEAMKNAYSQAWQQYSIQDPPDVDIIVMWSVKTNKFPFHDRWWFGDKTGIRVGTSIGGLGNRISEITLMSDEDCKRNKKEVESYIARKKRDFAGERLLCESFSLF